MLYTQNKLIINDNTWFYHPAHKKKTEKKSKLKLKKSFMYIFSFKKVVHIVIVFFLRV